ncbi:hypothetical protein [uncultured Polaribacter sp.]|uniref:hypothetical protein n=1 Tax=uncultured Polaribacter sp. TaxID=174711 RepID=UPI0030DBDFD4|tara:strand:- start:1514 stop:1948 length:435 start_codon:yes stop_codon:yes gene_type:complete
MLYNTTYKNKDAEATINNLIGKRYSFFESIKLKGTGSKRMIIEDVSIGFKTIMNTVSDVNYGNIELRSKGIIIHINKGLQNYSWAIPFYQLHIYKTNGYSLHAQGNYVRFKTDKLYKENKTFLDRILQLKVENEENYSFYENNN